MVVEKGRIYSFFENLQHLKKGEGLGKIKKCAIHYIDRQENFCPHSTLFYYISKGAKINFLLPYSWVK